ncbi:MAG: ATP-dependent zinc metalloprotease FtsH [Phycisphaerales bacterium]|nr:ATP-dependent zinc metalloprotease FtsH [Phycisphaerales bacterium]
MSSQPVIKSLLLARHPCIRIVTDDENEALSQVLEWSHATGLRDVKTWTVTEGLRDALLEGSPAVEKTTDAAAALLYLAAGMSAPMLVIALDMAPHLDEARAVRAWREAVEKFRRCGGVLVMVDSTDQAPSIVVNSSTRAYLPLPTDEELESVLRTTLRFAAQTKPVQVEVTKGEAAAIIANLRGLTRRQARQVVLDVISDDRRLDSADLAGILAAKRRLLQTSGLLEYVESPTTMDHIGGLSALKRWLFARQRGFSEKARDFGIDPPRGMLLLGVQGAGKSLCAKAVATAWKRPLLTMDPGVLYDRFVGESENRLRAALRQAEAMSPIILWIDEIEKAFASAASQSTDGGLSQRMFGTLLTWMQEHRAHVFLVATANNIDALPPELLRKGRFDEIFFVDLPSAEGRRQILEIHLRKRRRDPASFEIDRLIDASDGYSGAEIEQAIVSALHTAFSDNADVTTDRLAQALAASPPLSVTMAERIADLRAWAQGRCVMAE